MNFGENILKYRDDIIRDLGIMVSIPSVCGKPDGKYPYGKGSAKALDTILNMANEMGLSTKNVGYHAGHAEYGEGDENAAVLVHIDVVPTGDGWDTDPFTMTQKGSLLFGRGVADDKGAAVVALYCLKALKDAGITGKRRIRVIFGASEEVSTDDISLYFKEEALPVMGFTPDSEYGICNREKGIIHFTLSTPKNDSSVIVGLHSGTVANAVPDKAEANIRCDAEKCAELERYAKTTEGNFTFNRTDFGVNIHSAGTAAHAMQPQAGFNAATHLLALLNQVFTHEELGSVVAFILDKVGTEIDGKSLNIAQSDEQSGSLTFNLGLLDIDAEKTEACFDIRYPVTADGEKILDTIEKTAKENGLVYNLGSISHPLYVPEDSKFINLLQKSYTEITGEPCKLYSTGGGTYARAISGRGVAFGPFFEDEPDRRLHNSNENIDIDRFMKHAEICLEAMYHMFTDEI